MKKPYVIKAVYETVQYLEEDHDERDIHRILFESDEIPTVYNSREVTSTKTKLPKGWQLDCIPWGCEEEYTLKELLDKRKDYKVVESIQQKLTEAEISFLQTKGIDIWDL